VGSAAAAFREGGLSTANALVEAVEGALGSTALGRGDGAESPVVLSDEICLVPGKPVVRVEAAPGNARRIFTGIDVVALGCDVEEMVWATLTDYQNLAKVVPNLVSNTVLSAEAHVGARLQQVGTARLGGVATFTAQTTLDVREYRHGLPAYMEADHLDGQADQASAREIGAALPLRDGVFPRPYSISSLPHRDITMKAVGGDFRHYQGVWRMQSLPGCAPPGHTAMRLTYSVELSPRAWVPIALIEGNVARTLGENLEAIRDFVVEQGECCQVEDEGREDSDEAR